MREIDLFGRRFHVRRVRDGWAIHYPGAEGKQWGRRLELPIPPFVTTYDELADYLADLCHEWASPEEPGVRWVDERAGGADRSAGDAEGGER